MRRVTVYVCHVVRQRCSFQCEVFICRISMNPSVYCCIVYCCIVQSLCYLVGDGEGAGVGAGRGKHLFVRVVAAEFDGRVGNDPQHVHAVAAPEREDALVDIQGG